MNINLQRYGYEICKPHWYAYWTLPLHHKLYYCDGGTAYYIFNKEKIYLQKGHIYIFPMFSKCEVFNDKDDHFKVLWAHIDTIPIISNAKIYDIDANNNLYGDAITLFSNSLNRAQNIIEPLISYIINLALDDGLINCYEDEGLIAVMSYIKDNISQKITIEQLSNLVGYNKNYFIDVLKKTQVSHLINI